MSNISPWSDKQCLQVEPLWDLCTARRDAHETSFNFFRRWNMAFNFPVVLTGAILSTLTFNEDVAPPGLSSGLAIFMTVMTSTNSYFNLAKKEEGHRTTYRGFNMLLREIEMCLLRGQESPKRDFIDGDYEDLSDDNDKKL